MHTPILIIVGEAGSGKDTVAGFLAKNHGYAVIAQADPMKRYVGTLFKFTDEQLWGPSSSRNAEDLRFPPYHAAYEGAYPDADANVVATDLFVKEIAPFAGKDTDKIYNGLSEWFFNLKEGLIEKKRCLTPRAALQTFGTEFGRSLRTDLWSDLAMATADKLLRGGVIYTAQAGLINTPGFKGADAVVITDGRFRNEVLNVLKVGGQALHLLNPRDESAATEKAGIAGHPSEAEQKGIPESWFVYRIVNDKKLGLDVLEGRVHNLATNPLLKVSWDDDRPDSVPASAGRLINCS